MRQPRRLVAAGIAALAGCIYTFDNPVEKQSAGSVTGAVLLENAAPGQTIAGARVDLLWSNLSIELGQSGQFAFLDLPDGTYGLRYTVPPATDGGAPAVGERLDIYLPYTASAVPDTIALGTISVIAPATVEGTVTIDGGTAAGAVVGAFVPNGGAETGEYEGYSTTTDSNGHYSLALPHGNHTNLGLGHERLGCPRVGRAPARRGPSRTRPRARPALVSHGPTHGLRGDRPRGCPRTRERRAAAALQSLHRRAQPALSQLRRQPRLRHARPRLGRHGGPGHRDRPRRHPLRRHLHLAQHQPANPAGGPPRHPHHRRAVHRAQANLPAHADHARCQRLAAHSRRRPGGCRGRWWPRCWVGRGA